MFKYPGPGHKPFPNIIFKKKKNNEKWPRSCSAEKACPRERVRTDRQEEKGRVASRASWAGFGGETAFFQKASSKDPAKRVVSLIILIRFQT